MSGIDYIAIDLSDLKGMTPLDKLKLDSYISLIELLISSPDSTRYFNELHGISLKILGNNGVRKKGWISYTQNYNYVNEDDQLRLYIIYRRRLKNDSLHICLKRTDETTIADLNRWRGHLTYIRERDEDIFTKLPLGRKLTTTIKALLEYQPFMLDITNKDGTRKVINYK